MDRFKLEDAILAAEQVQNDLALLQEAVLDWPTRMSEDELCNYIMGIEYTTKLRQAKLWDVFKREFQLDEYRPRSTSFEDNELDLESDFEDGCTGCDDHDLCTKIPNFIKKDAA